MRRRWRERVRERGRERGREGERERERERGRERDRERKRERERERETDRQTDKKTDRQTDRHTLTFEDTFIGQLDLPANQAVSPHQTLLIKTNRQKERERETLMRDETEAGLRVWMCWLV